MTLAHERPMPGPAASFASTLAAHLPRLETERLILRAPRLDDIDAWHEVLTGPASPWLGGPFTRDESFAEFATSVGLWLLRGHGPWTVETKAGATLGFVLLGFEPGDNEPELGFLFRPEAEGQSYAAEAARAARAHAFGALGWDTVVSYIAPDNARSIRLAQRLGARRDAAAEAAIGDGTQVWRHHSGEVSQ